VSGAVRLNQLGDVLELRMRRSWRLFLAIAVPAFGALMAGVIVANLIDRRENLLADLLLAAFLLGTLGILVVIPGAAALIRLARGVPDVRIDGQGIVWGNDRTRDLQIDWRDVEVVSTRVQQTQYLTDRLIVLRARPDARPKPPRTRWGRILGGGQRVFYGSRFAISTAVEDAPFETIKAAIERHLGRPIEDG